MADVNKPELRKFRPLDPERPLSARSDDVADDARLFPSRRTFDTVSAAMRRNYRNLVFISFAMLLHFVAFSGMLRLQLMVYLSTLRVLAYGVMIIACLFLPSCLLNRYGCKWIAACSMVPFAVYYAVHFDMSLYVVVFALTIVVYMTWSTLWVAVCTYVTRLAASHADIGGDKESVTMVKFFGIFFAFYQIAIMLGRSVTDYVMIQGRTYDAPNATCGTLSCKSSLLADYGAASSATYQTVENDTMSDEANTSLFYYADDYDEARITTTIIFIGVYIGISILSVFIVILCVDNDGASSSAEKSRVVTSSEGCRVFLATFRQWRHLDLIFLIPLTIYNGLQQVFFVFTFVNDYVQCNVGVDRVPLMFVTFGLASAFGSLLIAYVTKYTGRVAIFIFGAACHCCLHVALFLWQPVTTCSMPYMTMALFWGLGDAAWQTQITAFYGSVFRNRVAAFSNMRLWEALGAVIAYSYGAFYVCVYSQLYVLLITMSLGMAGYFAVEYRRRNYSAEYLDDMSR